MIDETDIVERLKLRADTLRSEGQAMRAYLEDQAAAEIARLRADNQVAIDNIERLRELLKDAVAETNRLRDALTAMTAERDDMVVLVRAMIEQEESA